MSEKDAKKKRKLFRAEVERLAKERIADFMKDMNKKIGRYKRAFWTVTIAAAGLMVWVIILQIMLFNLSDSLRSCG